MRGEEGGMEDHQRRQRQNEAAYTGSSSRFSQDNQGRGPYTTETNDRYRSPTSSRRIRGGIPTSSSPSTSVTSSVAGTSNVTAGTSYGYYNESPTSFPTGMQYPAGYGADNRQQPNFAAAYTSNLMYNVQQGTNPSTIYEPAQQFPARASASMQLMGEGATYFPHEPTNAPAAASSLQQPNSSSSNVYQSGSADRSSIIPSYSTGMGGLAQVSGASEVMEDPEYTRTNLNNAYEQYQTALRNTFTNIKNKLLIEASQSLLEISEWLLSHVSDLGLHLDNAELHGDRQQLWDQFNNAWLSVFQAQKELALDLIENNRRPRHPQNMIPSAFIEKMGKELVRLCDGIEKHGLVDYQLGVWEEYIMTALTECLGLSDEYDRRQNEAGPSSLQ